MENKKFKHPYYYVYPTINSGGVVYVNDVPVMSNIGEKSKTGMISGQMPINHVLLQSGKYDVVGKMFPRSGEKAITEKESFMIDLEMFDAGLNWKETDHEFSPSIETPWHGLSENIEYPAFEIATKIEVELPFVLDGWQNSVDLREVKDIWQTTILYFRKLHEILSDHDAQKFLELSAEKEKLQATAFYYDEAKRAGIKQSIIGLFAENLEIMPLEESELKLEFWGYGRLVTLARIDGSAALQFLSPDPENQSNVELEVKLHMKKENEELCII